MAITAMEAKSELLYNRSRRLVVFSLPEGSGPKAIAWTFPLSGPDPTNRQAERRASKRLAIIRDLCDAAYTQGRAEADEELRADKATIYVYGLRDDFENVDRETGLPYEPITGCRVSPMDFSRTDGHNERISEYIRRYGLPRNSLKPWDKELFGLKDYFAAASTVARPLPLRIDGPPVTSPDGRYSIRPIKSPYYPNALMKTRRRKPKEILGVIVSVGDQDQPDAKVFWDEGNCDFVWGPKDSGFAVIRCPARGFILYKALDLNRGRWLREEGERIGE